MSDPCLVRQALRGVDTVIHLGATIRDQPPRRRVPLSEPLREHADSGSPLVLAEPAAPASQAIRRAARGIAAATPQELPVLQAVPNAAEAPPVSGTPLR